jgi:hypothetical protein
MSARLGPVTEPNAVGRERHALSIHDRDFGRHSECLVVRFDKKNQGMGADLFTPVLSY